MQLWNKDWVSLDQIIQVKVEGINIGIILSDLFGLNYEGICRYLI